MNIQKLSPTHYLLLAILIMVALHFLFPGAIIVPLPWDLLGLAPLAGGIAINLMADSAFHKAGTTVKPFQESTALITDGVFRLSRNPMYLGFVLVLIGIAVLLGSLTLWIIVPLFAVLMDRVFISVEERMLQVKFGQAWSEYKAQVRRWI
jgi:protein-S-isoprenylcysteine O-methyltransferase Ste14